MKLYEIPKQSKIYEEVSDGSELEEGDEGHEA